MCINPDNSWNIVETGGTAMESIFTALHTIINAYSFGMELGVIGLLAFGWIFGSTSVEYAQTLKRSSASGRLIAGLCGPPAILLGLSVILDSIWFQSYTKLPLEGGLLLAILIVAAVCQRLGHDAAQEVLVADGHEQATLLPPPKQRGS
jgi:hypothetical protein